MTNKNFTRKLIYILNNMKKAGHTSGFIVVQFI